jgi:hypothetical protein
MILNYCKDPARVVAAEEVGCPFVMSRFSVTDLDPEVIGVRTFGTDLVGRCS